MNEYTELNICNTVPTPNINDINNIRFIKLEIYNICPNWKLLILNLLKISHITFTKSFKINPSIYPNNNH